MSDVRVHITPGTVVTGGHWVPSIKASEAENVIQAEHNMAFLEAHPEYENVFSHGVLTRRIGKSDHYEHFRYFDVPVRAGVRDGPGQP